MRGSGRQNTVYIRPLDNSNIVQKSLLPNISDTITMQMQTTGKKICEEGLFICVDDFRSYGKRSTE